MKKTNLAVTECKGQRKYEALYSALVNLCEKEDLRLIEAELTNEKICYALIENRIILNTNYYEFWI